MTRYDRRLLIHRSYVDGLRGLYGAQVLTTQIPELSAFKVALACRQPVECFRRNCAAAIAMRALVEEILVRRESENRRQLAG